MKTTPPSAFSLQPSALRKKRPARVSPRALARARRQLEDAELEMNALYGDIHLHNKTIAEVRQALTKATGEDWRDA